MRISYEPTENDGTGIHHKVTGETMIVNMAYEDFDAAARDWDNGALIQEAFPDLSPEIREFILSGLLPEQFDELMLDIEEQTI